MRSSPKKTSVVYPAFFFLAVVFQAVAGANAPAPDAGATARFGNTTKITGWQCAHKARALAAENQHRAAIFWYLEAVKHHPPLRETLAREIGYQYTRAGEPEAAVAWYNICLSLRPDDIEARMGLARALGQCRRLDRALEQYQAALSIGNGLPLDLDLEINRITAWKDKK